MEAVIIHTLQERGELLAPEGRTHFDANWVSDASNVFDMSTIQLASAVPYPQKVGRSIVQPITWWTGALTREWELASHRVLVVKHECFVAKTTSRLIEVMKLREMDGPGEEIHLAEDAGAAAAFVGGFSARLCPNRVTKVEGIGESLGNGFKLAPAKGVRVDRVTGQEKANLRDGERTWERDQSRG